MYMYVCMYVCMYEYRFHEHTHSCICFFPLLIFPYACIIERAHVYVCMHVCMYVCIYACMNVFCMYAINDFMPIRNKTSKPSMSISSSFSHALSDDAILLHTTSEKPQTTNEC